MAFASVVIRTAISAVRSTAEQSSIPTNRTPINTTSDALPASPTGPSRRSAGPAAHAAVIGFVGEAVDEVGQPRHGVGIRWLPELA
jgi:hypothetical protein